jgi:hypothetical protein
MVHNIITHDLAASLAAVFVSVALVGQLGASLEKLENQRVRLATHDCDWGLDSTRERVFRLLEIVVDLDSR